MDKQIDEIMCWFNFESVKKTMDALNWTWSTSVATKEDSVPELGEIKMMALALMRDAANKKTIVSTGGFEADFRDKPSLRFIVEDWEVEHPAGGDEE